MPLNLTLNAEGRAAVAEWQRRRTLVTQDDGGATITVVGRYAYKAYGPTCTAHEFDTHRQACEWALSGRDTRLLWAHPLSLVFDGRGPDGWRHPIAETGTTLVRLDASASVVPVRRG